MQKIKLILITYSLIIVTNLCLADDNNIISMQNTNCKELVLNDNEYELTYEEKMDIASQQFESQINKNEQACDPNFKTTDQNMASGSSDNSSSAVAGGISGSQYLDESDISDSQSASIGSNRSLDDENKENNGSQIQGKDNTVQINGKIPECIARIGGDDEIAMQIKESISLVSDEEQRKELIKAYSDYKGLNIDVNEC